MIFSHFFSPVAIHCGYLRKPKNGFRFLTNGNTVFSKAIYGCKEGYRLSSERIRTCLPSGSWSYNAPRCICEYYALHRVYIQSNFVYNAMGTVPSMSQPTASTVVITFYMRTQMIHLVIELAHT